MPEHRYVITFMYLLLAILKIKDFVCENNINNCIIIYLFMELAVLGKEIIQHKIQFIFLAT